MTDLKCPTCNRFLGEFEGTLRLASCPGCRSEVRAQTTTTGLDEVQYRTREEKQWRHGRWVAVALRAGE